MKLKDRPKSKNVIDLRGGPSKESFMHELDSISATLRPRNTVESPKANKDLDNALKSMRRKNAVKQTRAPSLESILRRQTTKKQDRLK